ncbi:hypothetical protein HYY75_01185 [bacterium]|nr:hypothetical protein [bacterium]
MNKLPSYRCVLFCEDIRSEIGGRVSLMGVLGSKLFVQEFPLLFPKFCLFVEWGDIIGKVSVMLNIVPPEGVVMPRGKPCAEFKGQAGITARSMIILNGFVFPKAGPYSFEIIANNSVAGCETMVVEKIEAPTSTPN